MRRAENKNLSRPQKYMPLYEYSGIFHLWQVESYGHRIRVRCAVPIFDLLTEAPTAEALRQSKQNTFPKVFFCIKKRSRNA